MGSKKGDSVKVAVRVRPFNQREKDRGAQAIIRMEGSSTYIQNPETPKEEPKMFAFDFSYWSHDGFEDVDGVLEARNKKYATQRNVFDNLGQGVLDNAFEGYNCSLFAYGQTGSGKSFSMVGYGKNRGIVPITCDELFQAINKSTDGTKFEVTFSMLEIYNEQVRDLLTRDNPKGGLQVRQNPKLGLFYVEKLKKVAVGSYNEIERRMEEGTANRTVASTQMNATSSRAHTVVTITFDQIMKNETGQETKKSSSINLVDLAGSERADSTGATGDRLKEGANINKSLSALGNVISALADLSMGKKKVLVPYRDSVLTKLLMSALGGNSKTIMIAALSPADINYDETLSTLRYADRAKKIKNKAVVNENPIDKLIRELREENERLKQAAGGALPLQSAQPGMSPEEIEEMRRKMQEEIREQLLANQQMMDDNIGWDAKLTESRKEDAELEQQHSGKMVDPHFVNLNEDPMLSGVIHHKITKGKVTQIGRKDADPAPDIILTGLSIQKQHASITYDNDEIVIKPGSSGARTKVNGAPLTGERKLEHHDRVLLGSNHLYVFVNPLKPELMEGTPEVVDWDFAQKELAEQSGFSTLQSGMTKDQQRAQEQVLELLPMISEINAVSEELNKYRHFELVLISGGYQEDKDKGTKVMVKVKNLLNGNIWMWERGKFMNRRYMIQELYQKYVDGDDDYKKIKQDDDPFYDPPEDVMLGTANVFLQSLSYALDFDDKLTITDYKGQEEGMLYVAVSPCTANGKALDEDSFIEEPDELLAKPYYFKIQVRSGEINNSRYTKGCYIKYKTYGDETVAKTKTVKETLSPEFEHNQIVAIPSVTQEHLDYFDNGSVTFFVYGCQEDTPPIASVKKLTTKELREMDGQMTAPLLRRNTVVARPSVADSQLKSEIHTLQRKYDRLEKKEKRIQQICQQWKEKSKEEQDFESFMRAIHAVAFSSGNKLKSRVRLINHRDSDAFSVYSFEITEDMKFISGPFGETIQEEEEVELGARRVSGPLIDSSSPVDPPKTKQVTESPSRQKKVSTQSSEKKDATNGSSTNGKKGSINGKKPVQSNGSPKIIQAGKQIPVENGRPSPTTSGNSVKGSKACVLM